MKNAYNSAYVQIETLNFIFTRKPLLSSFIFVPTSKKSICRTPNINLQADYFLPIILKSTLIASKKINMAIYIH